MSSGGGLKVGLGVSLAEEEAYRGGGAHGWHGGCVGAVGTAIGEKGGSASDSRRSACGSAGGHGGWPWAQRDEVTGEGRGGIAVDSRRCACGAADAWQGASPEEE